jgi:hypothetical protein
MTYDWTVNAIGPFERLEYVGLVMVLGGLLSQPLSPQRDRLTKHVNPSERELEDGPNMKIRSRNIGISMSVSLISYLFGITVASSQDLTRARMEFLTMCSPCHGDDGKGAGPKSANLRTRPADLTTLARETGGAFTPGMILQKIDGRTHDRSHGLSDMPIWGCRDSLGGKGEVNPPESRSFEPFVNLACDSEAVIQGRLRNIVEYLRTIQVN